MLFFFPDLIAPFLLQFTQLTIDPRDHIEYLPIPWSVWVVFDRNGAGEPSVLGSTDVPFLCPTSLTWVRPSSQHFWPRKGRNLLFKFSVQKLCLIFLPKNLHHIIYYFCTIDFIVRSRERGEDGSKYQYMYA